MAGIKKFIVGANIFLGLLVGLGGDLNAQSLSGTPSINYTSYISPTRAQIATDSNFFYQRASRTKGTVYTAGSGSLSLGFPTDNYSLYVSTTMRVQKNLISNLKTDSSVNNFSSTITTLFFDKTNSYVVTLNYAGTDAAATLNIDIPTTWETGTLARHLRLYIKYVNNLGQALKRLTLVPPTGFELKWPSGDSPVFTKKPGRMDIVSLYWTGPDWPISSAGVPLRGVFYGTVSFDHPY